MKRMRNDAGVTLMEIMIIVAIMAILTMVSVPNISRWISSHRLSSTAQQIASEMQLARAKAVSERQNINFAIVTGMGFYATYQYSPGGQLKHCTHSVTISGVSGDNPIVFNSRGMASNDTNISLINEKGMTKAVNVNVAGRVVVN